MKKIKSFDTIVFLLLFTNLSFCFAQDYPIRPQLEDKASFSIILIPDPQSYIKYDTNQPLFELQTAWIANNQKRLKIKTALCLGDLVEQNDLLVPNHRNGNQTSKEQWSFVSRAFKRLDHQLPYIVCTGNHDYGVVNAENRQTHLSEYFYPERNSCWKDCLIATAPNDEGNQTLENAAYLFNTDNWGKLIVLSLEFAPRQEALNWAQKICKKYEDHRIILLTHSLLDCKGKHYKQENYKISPANYGETIWEKLIYPTPNIVFAVCGHSCNIGSYQQNVSFRYDKNINGKEIPQMMFNAQTADGKWSGNGGDCWMRILEFLPDGESISVRTFSPLFALSSLTCDKAWRTDSYDQFTFKVPQLKKK